MDSGFCVRFIKFYVTVTFSYFDKKNNKKAAIVQRVFELKDYKYSGFCKNDVVWDLNVAELMYLELIEHATTLEKHRYI